MCLFPVRAEKQEFGRPKLDPEGQIQLPCGKCFECISKRAVDWATRARHEISSHNENCFLTLTYDEENLPSFLIVKAEFQKFIKRLRKKTKTKLRYMVSHEYGGRTGRPHHHAIVFGYSPNNQYYYRDSPSGEPLFRSKELEKLWTHGYSSIGTANEKTAYYIASYSLKSSKHWVTNPTTGESTAVTDSMDASKRPAIGANFFLRNYQQILDTGKAIPRYYKKLLERHHPDLLAEYENEQILQNNNPRSDHELLAKYVITDQQKSLNETGYRQSTTGKNEIKLYKDHLVHNRDRYVSKTKGK